MAVQWFVPSRVRVSYRVVRIIGRFLVLRVTARVSLGLDQQLGIWLCCHRGGTEATARGSVFACRVVVCGAQ